MINKLFDGLLGKIALAGALALSAPAAANPPEIKADIPAVKLDDGRPSLARTYDEENKSWYLTVPIVPYLKMDNIGAVSDMVTLAGNTSKLQIPDIEIGEEGGAFNSEGIQKFLDDVSSFPSIDGNLAVGADLGFGILTRYVEIHASARAEGRADFKFKTISNNYNLDAENSRLIFDNEQTILQGLAYGDIIGKGRVVVPVKLGDFLLKPFVGGGYKHREAAQFMAYMDKVVDSDDDVICTAGEKIRSYGDGYFLNAGVKADFSKLESKIMRPVAAFTVDNIHSKMNYAANHMGLPEKEPVMFNAGLQISPFSILNLRADFLDITRSPEIRVEAERSFGPLELAVFGRLNEKNLFGEKRNSANAYIGVVAKAVNFGLYGSFDNKNQFGAGLALSLGWHPEMK